MNIHFWVDDLKKYEANRIEILSIPIQHITGHPFLGLLNFMPDISGLQNEDGSFSGDEWGEVDSRYSFYQSLLSGLISFSCFLE
jgi:hypothetical protein